MTITQILGVDVARAFVFPMFELLLVLYTTCRIEHEKALAFILTDQSRAEGLDHLLSGGRGAGGKKGAESEELKAACFMSLVSCLASAPEVLRVTPLHKEKMMNAVASSIVQAGSIDVSDKPLTAAGLDGSGEVIQVKLLLRCMHNRGGGGGVGYRNVPPQSSFFLFSFGRLIGVDDVTFSVLKQFVWLTGSRSTFRVSFIRPEVWSNDGSGGKAGQTDCGKDEAFGRRSFRTQIFGIATFPHCSQCFPHVTHHAIQT